MQDDDESRAQAERLAESKYQQDQERMRARWLADQDIYVNRRPRTRETYAGVRFGMLVGVRAAGHDKGRRLLVEFKCDCGIDKIIRFDNVRKGKVQSCGCMQAKMQGGVKNNQIERGLLRLGVVKSNTKRLVEPPQGKRHIHIEPTEQPSDLRDMAIVRAHNLVGFSGAVIISDGLDEPETAHTKGTSACMRETLVNHEPCASEATHETRTQQEKGHE